MAANEAELAPVRGAALVNLLLPGGGLILAGAVWNGLAVGLLFAACLNFAILAVALFPDDFGRTYQMLGIGAVAGGYVGAQIRLAQTLREQRAAAAIAARRRVLAEVQECIAGGALERARRVLEPAQEQWPHDLLVAYRLAQVLTGLNDVAGAQAAWERVRVLDRHGLYRAQVRQQGRGAGGGGTQSAWSSPEVDEPR